MLQNVIPPRLNTCLAKHFVQNIYNKTNKVYFYYK